MRAVVTGAAGFMGSHVAEIVRAEGHEVLGIDDLSGGFVDNLPAGIAFKKFRPDIVFHLAAYAAEGLSHHIPVFNYVNNVIGTVSVLSAAYRSGAKHFVFTSSIAAYGHPHSDRPFDEGTACVPCDPYGTAKLACENHIRSVYDYHGGPAYTIFRPHNVFGSRQNISDPYRNVVGIFMACAMQNKPMPVFGDGSQTRSFSHIGAVAYAIATSPFTTAARNQTFNIGGDEPMSVKTLAEIIAAEFSLAPNLQLLVARKEVQHAHCAHDLARRVFPEAYRRALDIRSGIKEMAAYVRCRPISAPTECPSPIELYDHLPPSWSSRLMKASN
jgi:UDP-glucose 4-epimerase